MAETLVAMEVRPAIDPQAIPRGGVSSDIKLPSLASFDQIQPVLQPIRTANTEVIDPQAIPRGGVSSDIKLPSLASFDQIQPVLRAPVAPRNDRVVDGSHETWKDSARKVTRRIGAVAVLAVVSVGALIGPSMLPRDSGVATSSAQETPAPTVAELPNDSMVIPGTPPVETTPPTTAEPEPVPLWTALPPTNEEFGILKFGEEFCGEEVILGQYHVSEDATIGNGDAYIDQRIPDETPNQGCEARDQRIAEIEAETGLQHVGRVERGLTEYQPIAGHAVGDINENGATEVLSVLPGEKGNSVFAGHGSTKNGAFGDIGLLRPGDTATIELPQNDGVTLHYEVIEIEIVDDSEYARINDYTHPDYESTLTIFRCDDGNGNTGSGVARYVVRLGLTSTSGNGNYYVTP